MVGPDWWQFLNVMFDKVKRSPMSRKGHFVFEVSCCLSIGLEKGSFATVNSSLRGPFARSSTFWSEILDSDMWSTWKEFIFLYQCSFNSNWHKVLRKKASFWRFQKPQNLSCPWIRSVRSFFVCKNATNCKTFWALMVTWIRTFSNRSSKFVLVTWPFSQFWRPFPNVRVRSIPRNVVRPKI